MDDKKSALRRLILFRLLLVCLLIMATRLTLPAQALAGLFGPYFLGILILSGVFLLWLHYSPNTAWLYEVQFFSDLVLVGSLVYFSGGIDSLFIPLYTLIIVYACFLKGRQGGFLAVTLAILSCVAIVHLEFIGSLPGQEGHPSARYLVYRLSVFTLAFLAVAFLGMTLSERLQKAGKKLHRAEELQENIIQSIRSGLLTTDKSGTVHYANRVAQAILGLASSPQGRSISEIFSSEAWRSLEEHNYDSSHRALRLEAWIERPDRTKACIGMSGSPLLSQEQETIGYVVSFQDLTEIKKKEEDYQLREKLAAVGELASGLAHELRNPLASLSGSIQILRSELDLSERQARLLEIVLRESERLNRTVGDFLEYARPREVPHEKIDLGALLRETVELLRNSQEFTSGMHRLSVQVATAPVLCSGNPDQLRQVAWNILQNGVRAMPQGGRLEVSLSPGDGQIRMEVKDEGIGMTKATREKLFQPFQSSFPGGSGLGMALVYQIVLKHGGRIEVDSAPGKGTRITILLPSLPGSQV